MNIIVNKKKNVAECPICSKLAPMKNNKKLRVLEIEHCKRKWSISIPSAFKKHTN